MRMFEHLFSKDFRRPGKQLPVVNKDEEQNTTVLGLEQRRAKLLPKGNWIYFFVLFSEQDKSGREKNEDR